uniref:Uncharacterized protein n=1 Tax=uncultured marine microorganism HF4000_APKG2J17 TaxID=455546 RepID=B3T6L8_9ZZZZ|nr:hypothetical protein ALOHA_HF4000APKG2J17ctg1g34 [uncultured marine microorganism HF4000_APKG2J17]
MGILQVYSGGVSVPPLESYAPVAGNMNAVAFGLPAERVEVKPRNAHVLGSCRRREGIEPYQAAGLELNRDAGGFPGLGKLFESLVFETPDHTGTVNN